MSCKSLHSFFERFNSIEFRRFFIISSRSSWKPGSIGSEYKIGESNSSSSGWLCNIQNVCQSRAINSESSGNVQVKVDLERNTWALVQCRLWRVKMFSGSQNACFCMSQFRNRQFSLSCPTLCDPMDCSTPGFPVHHQLPEVVQTHVHWIGDATQPCHPLSSPSPASCHSAS